MLVNGIRGGRGARDGCLGLSAGGLLNGGGIASPKPRISVAGFRFLLAQTETLELAGLGLGQLGDVFDLARVLVGRDLVLDEILQDLGRRSVGREAGAEDDERLDDAGAVGVAPRRISAIPVTIRFFVALTGSSQRHLKTILSLHTNLSTQNSYSRSNHPSSSASRL